MKLVVDLGMQPLANSLPDPGSDSSSEPRYPLRLAVCRHCWLLQITDLVPPQQLFSDYVYFSSFSDAMLKHAAEAVSGYVEDYSLGKDSFVIEIASNDGYLLKNFVAAGVPCLGVEPAENIAVVAREAGVETLVEFFGAYVAEKLAAEGRQADLILGNNVFAHVPDTNDFVAGLSAALKDTGRIALEFPYAGDFIEKTEFDTVYHEHVFYFSLTALKPLFERHGLSIFDVDYFPIHGGSIRLFACHTGAYPVSDRLKAKLAEEKEKGVDSDAYYQGFSDRVHGLRDSLNALLKDLKGQGKSVAAYGASAKGSTLMNFFGLDHEVIDFVADRSTHKQGKLTPGTGIPVVAPEALLERMPDYTVLLTWNFKDEILAQQAEYRTRGGKFIVPIPEVRIV